MTHRGISPRRVFGRILEKNSILHQGQVADSTFLKINLENHARTAPHRGLVPQEKAEIWNLSLTSLNGQFK